MGNLLSTVDLLIFFGSLVAVMALGLWAGRKEDTSEDFYLAGRTTRWWGVAGSIFGSNVSANHIVGMMGVGFAVGFAQSHFEITAIAGLLLLCYGFLPVYRKLNLFTLSQYLSQRYDDSSRVAYALIMIVIMVVIQMVPGFYIGSRSLYVLLQQGATATATATVDDSGVVTEITLQRPGMGYGSVPEVRIEAPPGAGQGQGQGQQAAATVALMDDAVGTITLTSGGAGYDPALPPQVLITGGATFGEQYSPGDVNPNWYRLGILLMALVTGTYTIIGGLKAVIVTDVIQSVLLLGAGLMVAMVTFAQPEVGGWGAMVAMDAAGADKLHLYNASSHPELPWTGVLSGLMVLHFYYWGTNQFIVQRALSASDDRQARLGIITAGFFKLMIPFFAIGTGIAAYYLFQQRGMNVAQDAVFVTLLTELVAPIGFGLVGLVAAGMVGAILSSLDSMMNSAATIFTFDIYKQYVQPEASERTLIWVGRWCIVASITVAAALTIFTMDPNSTDSFFLYIASHQAQLIAGVVVAFALGMLWKRATAAGAIAAIVGGVVFSYGLPPLYNKYLGTQEAVAQVFGERLNFLHTVFLAAMLALGLHVVISLLTTSDPKKSQLTWTGMGVFQAAALRRTASVLGLSLGLYAALATAVVAGWLLPATAAWLAATWTWLAFSAAAVAAIRSDPQRSLSPVSLLREDRFWAGLLAALAVFMMYYFF